MPSQPHANLLVVGREPRDKLQHSATREATIGWRMEGSKTVSLTGLERTRDHHFFEILL